MLGEQGPSKAPVSKKRQGPKGRGRQQAVGLQKWNRGYTAKAGHMLQVRERTLLARPAPGL